MVDKSHGPRHKTRRKLKKGLREKFKVTPYLQKFEIGQKVAIDPDPSSHRGMPFRRFVGRIGIVKGMRGKAYLVEVKDGGKVKTIISMPEHLKPVE